MKSSTILAVTGKGGVGKTSISAAATRILCEKFPNSKILAIDADPAMGLSTALGVEVKETLDDIRKRVVDNAASGETREAVEMLGEARYHIFDAMVEKNGFAFLAVGRPEAAGCYCSVNSYLREVINMLAQEFDYVIIDGEAGIEQVNRRVMEKVTHLVFVTDQSRKGLQVIKTIKKVADDLCMYEHSGIIVNRVLDPEMNKLLDTGNVPVLSYINQDNEHAANEISGRTIFDLAPKSFLIKGTEEALQKLAIIE